jgi:hypothetical protein
MAWDTAKPFGLNAIRLVRSAVVVNLRAAQTLTFTPRLIGGELKGNDQIVSVGSAIEAIEWSFEEGGISLDALALMTGFTATTSGSTPNQVNTLKMLTATAFPYFKIYGKILGEGSDDVHVKIHRAKITGNIEGQFQYGEFYVAKLSGIAVYDSTATSVVDIVMNETAASLPAS